MSRQKLKGIPIPHRGFVDGRWVASSSLGFKCISTRYKMFTNEKDDNSISFGTTFRRFRKNNFGNQLKCEVKSTNLALVFRIGNLWTYNI